MRHFLVLVGQLEIYGSFWFGQMLDIDRQKFDDAVCNVICCVAWKPTRNALANYDAMGNYGIWDLAVLSSMKSLTEGISDLQSMNNGLLFLYEEEEPKICGSRGELVETN